MATMHYLFFGLFLVALLCIGRTGHRAIKNTILRLDEPDVLSSVGGSSTEPAAMLGLRDSILFIAAGELGVRETTGKNDGARIAEYLAYTGLSEGHAWCAAFVSWCYGRVGLPVPRSPWSPALFPVARRYKAEQMGQTDVRPADLFGIYNSRLHRIDHVGLVWGKQGRWLLTIEGNVSDRVLSKRRPWVTIQAFSNWLD